MSLSSQLLLAVAEGAVSIHGCRVCQRRGLAILPLRQALVPKMPIWHHLPDPEIPDTQLGLRILRAGYLYVLLDDSVWQAYQVTVDGYLRQFDPHRAPWVNQEPLNRACVNADHDMPASFLNIDTDRYRRAALAFTSNPWPASVLERYKTKPTLQRLQVIDLATARDNPRHYGEFLTADQPHVHKTVYEYREYLPGFHSVHGFHSRGVRQVAFRNYLRTVNPHAVLGPGVLALVVDDQVGLVQEYNAMRAAWAHARQVWIEEPERAYQHQTSQILLTIRALHRQWAEPKVPVAQPWDVAERLVVPGAWETERQRRIERLAQASDKRLEDRYDERKRADFQKAYDRQRAAYQKEIDRYGELYAAAFASDGFRCAEQHDYDDTLQSGIAYSKTLALCLRGGISEAAGNDSGPTVRLWQTLLNDPQSPIYKALLIRDKPLLAALLPSFQATRLDDWNDSALLYALLKAATSSDEARQLIRPYLQEAIAQMLGALNTASARLKGAVGAGVECAVSRLNTASQLLYNGVHLVELRLQMKLGEYYTLQSAHVRAMQQSFANGVDRAGVDAHKKVQPLILGGVLNLAVLDPKVAAKVIQVSVWVQGTLDDLIATLNSDRGLPSSYSTLAASPHLVPVSIGAGTLDPQARQILESIKVGSQQVSKWVRTGFSGLTGAVGSADLLLSMGSLYLMNDSLSKNLQAARDADGDLPIEASLALEGSALAVLGGVVELVGFALEKSVHRAQASNLIVSGSEIAQRMAMVGNLMIRWGGITIAATGIWESLRAGFAAGRSHLRGDSSAKYAYIGSAVFFGSSSLLGMRAAAARLSIFTGPVGWAISLALAGYVLYKWAEQLESTPLERWAKRCYFGVANENPKIHWHRSASAATAIAELNAITMGLEVIVDLRFDHVGFNRGNLSNEIPNWFFKILLPHFDESRSAYRWWLAVHRHSKTTTNSALEDDIVSRGELSPPDIVEAISEPIAELGTTNRSTKIDYRISAVSPSHEIRTLDRSDGSSRQVGDIRGRLTLMITSERLDIAAVTLSVTYWPDKSIVDGYAKIVTTSAL